MGRISDTDSSEEEFDGQMEKICAEFGGLGNFKATDAGPSSRKGGAKTQGSNLQSVKGAKGRHDNEYWRNLSKLKKVAQSAPGEKEKRKDRKDRKRREKAEKKKDPQLVSEVALVAHSVLVECPSRRAANYGSNNGIFCA